MKREEIKEQITKMIKYYSDVAAVIIDPTYHLDQLLQEGHQLQQLIVILVHEPALYGNPIGQLWGQKTCQLTDPTDHGADLATHSLKEII